MPIFYIDTDAKKILDMLLEESSKNQQLVGRFQLRPTGIKKLLGRIDLDIIAQKPHFLYLSIDSFFKQPERIITYDGEKLSGIEEERLDAILNLDIGPAELVEVLLRNFSLDKSKIKHLSIQKNLLLVQLRSGNTLQLELNPTCLQIQKRTVLDRSGYLIYAVDYSEFPKRYGLEATYKGQKHSMTLSSNQVKINEGIFDEQLFHR